MRKLLLLSLLPIPLLSALTGCAATTSYVHSDAALGRVVVYRNGVAYFERTAKIDGNTLSLAVPADKVDDFLKSLTVIDARTGKPAPISYPTKVPSSETGLMEMKIQLEGSSPHELRVSYVTEAPSWKPSYRVVIGKGGKVNVQAWAIVDNTSGEDWQDVQLGVGSSSAMSFRYDLRSVRVVQRETLHTDDLFAQAPPMGGATYANQPGQQGQQRVVMEFDDATLAANVRREVMVNEERPKVASKKNAPPPVMMQQRSYGAAAGGKGRGMAGPMPMDVSSAMKPQEPQQAPSNQLDNMARSLKSSNKQVIVEGYAGRDDVDKRTASLERANRAREQLIRNGLDPNRVVAVGNGEQSGRSAGVRIVEAPVTPVGGLDGKEGKKDGEKDGAAAQGTDPIGQSHFESKNRMSVVRGMSAMVSILDTDTDGEVVYFYDAESARGNSQFPFRAVRIKNPTDSVLESGPVTVFGQGKFIGEGLSEPIPAHSNAFVPFALDRQIVVERKEADVDKIARIITVQRGVFSTEVQHTKRSTLVINNRFSEKAAVYVRHTVAAGYKLTKSPASPERLGAAYVFRVDVEANGKAELVLEESTPVFKSTDIRSQVGMEMVTAYLSSAAVEGPLRASVDQLLKLHKEMANIDQRIGTTRDQMGEYRARMDELHAQIVTLKMVKTAGPLMQSLEKKLQEVSDKLSKATIDLVAYQEKLMVARIKFQDGVADLSLEKKSDEKPAG